MRMLKLNKKSAKGHVLVPSLWSQRNAIMQAIHNLTACQRPRSSITLNPKDTQVTTTGCDGSLQYVVNRNFGIIRKAMDSYIEHKSTSLEESGSRECSYAYALYALTSPKVLEMFFSTLIYWIYRGYASFNTGTHVGLNKSENLTPLKHSYIVSQTILAYTWYFYSQKTSKESDISFLVKMSKLRESDCYLQFAKDVISRIRISIAKQSHSAQTVSCRTKASASPVPISPSQIAHILKILAKNSFLYDQRLVLLGCAALSAQVNESRLWGKRYFISTPRFPPLSSILARDCILSLHRMHVYHTVMRDLLLFMARMKETEKSANREARRKTAIWNVNHFIEAFLVVAKHKELISPSDFIFFMRNIIIHRDSISTKSASHLIALLKASEIQNRVSSSTGCGSVDHDSSWLRIPKFYARKNDAESSFTVNKMNASCLSEILDPICDIVLKNIGCMCVIQVARVLEGLISNSPCPNPGIIFSSLFEQVKKIYRKRQLDSRQRGKKTKLRKSYMHEQYLAREKLLFRAHAILLVLLPCLEARFESIRDDTEDSIGLDCAIYSKIARCIPLRYLKTNFRIDAPEIVLMIRRAYCDFPKLYSIEPRLWDAVKSFKIHTSNICKRKLYRFSISEHKRDTKGEPRVISLDEGNRLEAAVLSRRKKK